MNTLIELGRLHWTRPAADAAAPAVARWYEAKAAVHEHLAAECTDLTDRSRELAHARRARVHAQSLLRAAPQSMNGAMV